MDYKIIPVGRAKDIRGQKFGRLTVLERAEKPNGISGSYAYWLCQCDCGEMIVARGSTLRYGDTRSCGCLNRERIAQKNAERIIDLTGTIFGWLLVEGYAYSKGNEGSYWRCVCRCGNKTVVSAGNLKTGSTVSCGCKRKKYWDSLKKPLVGKKFGRLKIKEEVGKNKWGNFEYECQCVCGNIQVVSASDLLSGHTRSCGCLRDELSAKRGRYTIRYAQAKNKGKNHYRYNPRLTDEERMNNRYQLYGENQTSWRVRVFENDNYTCQLCKERAGVLNAHHLNSWDTFPEERFDIDNGITLCESCHKAFHVEYGYGENTKEQFEEFASNYKQALTG